MSCTFTGTLEILHVVLLDPYTIKKRQRSLPEIEKFENCDFDSRPTTPSREEPRRLSSKRIEQMNESLDRAHPTYLEKSNPIKPLTLKVLFITRRFTIIFCVRKNFGT